MFAFPVAARVAEPLPHADARCGCAVDRHHARVVRHLLQDHDGLGRLHDLQVAVVAGAGARRAEGDAALAERQILGTVGRDRARPLSEPSATIRAAAARGASRLRVSAAATGRSADR